MDFSSLLETLNPQQQRAATADDGPVLVLAGPGSGKTRTLTFRIAYLLDVKGIRPYRILAVTFTNKAAREVRERVDSLLGEEKTEGIWLGTFHATCARILRRESLSLPFDSNFVIFDADDQRNVVKTAIHDLNLDDKRYRPRAVHAAISNAKNELIEPADFPVQTYRDEVVKRVYERYQDLLLQNNALDFDDLLFWTARLLEEFPETRERYASRFEHLLVDEFQDTNMAQYVLLKHLASVHRNLFVVGDPDQSIYGWRGADYRNIYRFEKDFPEAELILLEQNYRSVQRILDTAMAVIQANPNRKDKRLFTERGEGEKVFYYEAADDYAEAAFVVDTILHLTAKGEVKPQECAVMYRTNAQSRLLEEAFLQARIPYKLVGAQRFYGRREIKDILAYLRLIHNPADQVSLTRVVAVPPRGIGSKTLMALHLAAQKAKLSPGVLLLELGRNAESPWFDAFSSRAAAPLARFGALLAEWHDEAKILPVSELFDKILEDLRYQMYLGDDEEGRDRWENVMELRRLAAEYDDRTLGEFLETVALVSDQDTLDNTDAPSLMTLHAAKGLEFRVVFIVGLDDGVLPHSRSFDEVESLREERRLFYVGITRAKDRLYLVRALQRGRYGSAELTDPSRFLDDIPQDYLNGVRRGAPRRKSPSRWMPKRTQGSSPRVMAARYRVGDHVRHPVWGAGIVLKSELQKDEEIVTVVFESEGIKRVAASVARLEKQ